MVQNQVKNNHNNTFSQLQGYYSNPQKTLGFDYNHSERENAYNPIIEGYFPKENTKKEMAIRKINTTLTTLLGIFILSTSISYYFATANEMTLNDLSRQTVVLNDENADLQNKLDKLKSFNNVDSTMQRNNILQKAQQVIEVNAVATGNLEDKKISPQKPFSWAIGY